MGYYDVMQVCENGHQITDKLHSYPQHGKNFCDECGAKTISQCPECGVDIRGDYINEGIIMIGSSDTPVPKRCANCGASFPWSKSKEKDENTATISKNIVSIIIHPKIYSHIEQYLNTGDYFHAVEEAYKIVREKLKHVSGSEKATDAFKNENCKKICGYVYEQGTVDGDFFDAIKFLHMAVQFFRNEKFHKPADNLEKNLAIHYLSLASLAYELIVKK